MKLFKKIFHLNFLPVSFFILLFAPLLGWLSSQINLLSALEYSVTDFDFTDIVYQQLAKDSSIGKDANVVIVNIGDLNRQQLARQINMINSYAPRAIAINAFFFASQDAAADTALVAALGRAKKLVLASRLEFDADQKLEKVLSEPKFLAAAHTGFVNAGLTDTLLSGTWRSFLTRQQTDASPTEYAFAVQAARLYDSAAAGVFLARGNQEEIINFRGNRDKFHVLEKEDFTAGNPKLELLRDKLVLLGFTGTFYRDAPNDFDRYYTPMNEQYVGRSFPDMYGLVVHANIVSMILSGKYVENAKATGNLLSFVVLYLSIVALAAMYRRSEASYGIYSKLFAFVLINLLVWSSIHIYESYSIKIDLRLAIFYLLIAPDAYEIYEHNLARRLRNFIAGKLLRKWQALAPMDA